MKNQIYRSSSCKPRNGAIIILVAILLPVILWMAAFAIDVSYMQLTRTELRIATDAGTRAGARTLSLFQDSEVARRAAQVTAAKNTVGGEGLSLADSDIEFGFSKRVSENGRYDFTSGGSFLNSVHVTGRRTEESIDGPVNLYLAPIFGQNFFNR